jgi:hypothetical protein
MSDGVGLPSKDSSFNRNKLINGERRIRLKVNIITAVDMENAPGHI